MLLNTKVVGNIEELCTNNMDSTIIYKSGTSQNKNVQLSVAKILHIESKSHVE